MASFLLKFFRAFGKYLPRWYSKPIFLKQNAPLPNAVAGIISPACSANFRRSWMARAEISFPRGVGFFLFDFLCTFFFMLVNFIFNATWVVAIAVFVFDLSLAVVIHRFHLFLLRKFLRLCLRRRLRVMHRQRFRHALFLYRPIVSPGNTVKIFLCHSYKKLGIVATTMPCISASSESRIGLCSVFDERGTNRVNSPLRCSSLTVTPSARHAITFCPMSA